MTHFANKTLSPLIKTVAAGALIIGLSGQAFAGDCDKTKVTKTAEMTNAADAPFSTSTQTPEYPNVSVYSDGVKLAAYRDHHSDKKNMKKGTIVDAAMATDSLSTLVAAVKAADLVDALSGEGPLTVFAPTNDAFDALPAGTVDTLLMPENQADLQKILKAHVVAGKLSASDIIELATENGGMVEVETLSGDTLTAVLKDDTLYVKDENGGLAGVAKADIMKSNGVVHVVDKVLLPS
jgi:uncharacterized surface protein with fasciclin (FAS1) repeats